MYFAMLNAIHRMTNIKSQQLKSLKYLDNDIVKIYEQTRKYWSQYYKSIPGCHIGKIQIKDHNNKTKYIDKNNIDDIVKNGYKTNQSYFFNKWNIYFQSWKTIGFNDVKTAYNLVIKLYDCKSTQNNLMAAFKKFVPEYTILKTQFDKEKLITKHTHIRINKYHVQHKKYTAEELEFVNTHSIQESMKFLNITYNAVTHIRSRLNKKRSHKYEKRI